jgi:hypothetical protein
MEDIAGALSRTVQHVQRRPGQPIRLLVLFHCFQLCELVSWSSRRPGKGRSVLTIATSMEQYSNGFEESCFSGWRLPKKQSIGSLKDKIHLTATKQCKVVPS